LWREFRVDLAVGLVTAGRDVEIMDADTPRTGRLDNRRDVPRVADRAVGLPPVIAQRPSRDDGHAVIALLAVDREMLVSELAEGSERKCVVGALGFLQAQHIGLFGLEKMLNQRQPSRTELIFQVVTENAKSKSPC
jgi:hypothetical protein